MQTLARLLFAALVCSLVTFAQTDKPATASITGRITFDKQPLPGVTVVLEPGSAGMMVQSAARRPVSAKTDAEGRYRLAGIAAGTYIVSPRALAYVMPTENMMGRAGKTINLNDGEQIENMDFTVVKGGVITGRVTDHQDRPVVGQRVQLRRFTTNVNSAPVPFSSMNFTMFETDDRGMYRLFGLPAGRYTLSLGEGSDAGMISMGRTGKFYPLTFYPNARTEKEAKVIELSEGGEVTDIDIKLPKPEKSYEAKGRVIDASTGAPLVGITLMYRPIGSNPAMIGAMNLTQERTNAAGEFTLIGLLPGKYGAVIQELETASEYYSDPITFEVMTSDVEGLEIKATRGVSISGFVIIEGTSDPAILKGVTSVLVNASSATPPAPNAVQMPTFGGRQQTKPDGSFRLTGIRPGATRISALLFDGSQPLTLARVERDGVELTGPMDVAAGDQITGIKVVMMYGSAVVRGQVNIVSGTLPPETQLMVSARRLGGAMGTGVSGGRPGQVDARGKFVLENLAPGEYEIVLSTFQRTGMTPGSTPRTVRQKLTVGTGETPVTLTLDLSEKKEGQQ
ncbi:MAG TPA: carboxypeptidase-like regulatory domain-containing protein [Blastocatellia bacterium]|nr:carboxypeptidase-like regulatory domain-containing protein [Blastocatellia bacterium]